MERAKDKKTGEEIKLFYNEKDTNKNGVGIAVKEFLKDSLAAL